MFMLFVLITESERFKAWYASFSEKTLILTYVECVLLLTNSLETKFAKTVFNLYHTFRWREI